MKLSELTPLLANEHRYRVQVDVARQVTDDYPAFRRLTLARVKVLDQECLLTPNEIQSWAKITFGRACPNIEVDGTEHVSKDNSVLIKCVLYTGETITEVYA